jgi:MFS family permease
VPFALGVLVWAVLTSSAPVVSERRPVTIDDVTRGGVLQASVLAFVARGAIFAIWLLVPFYLVDTRGLGASVGGIFFMLTPLGAAVAAPVGGRVSDRVGASAPAVTGLVMQTAGLGFLGFVDGATSLWLIALALFVAGFGLGFFEVPNMTTIMVAFPPGRQGAAGGLAFLTRTLGVVAGVALLGELVAARSATVGFLGAFEESLRASAVAVGAAFLLALVGRRARR